MNQMKSMGNQCCVTVMEWIVVKWTDFQHFLVTLKGKACMNDLTQPYPYNNEYEEKMTNAHPYTATACRQQKTDTKRGEQNKKLGIVCSITIKHMYSVPDRVLYSLLLPAGSSSSGIP